MWREAAAHLHMVWHDFVIRVEKPARWWENPTNRADDRIIFVCSCGHRLSCQRRELPPDVMDLTDKGLTEMLTLKAQVTAYGHILGEVPELSRRDVLGIWLDRTEEHAAQAHRKVGKFTAQDRQTELVHRCSCGWTNVLHKEQFKDKEEWRRAQIHLKSTLTRTLEQAASRKARRGREGEGLLDWMEDETVQPR